MKALESRRPRRAAPSSPDDSQAIAVGELRAIAARLVDLSVRFPRLGMAFMSIQMDTRSLADAIAGNENLLSIPARIAAPEPVGLDQELSFQLTAAWSCVEKGFTDDTGGLIRCEPPAPGLPDRDKDALTDDACTSTVDLFGGVTRCAASLETGPMGITGVKVEVALHGSASKEVCRNGNTSALGPLLQWRAVSPGDSVAQTHLLDGINLDLAACPACDEGVNLTVPTKITDQAGVGFRGFGGG